MKKITFLVAAVMLIGSMAFSQKFPMQLKHASSISATHAAPQGVLTATCDTTYPKSFTTGHCNDSLTIFFLASVPPYADSGYASGENAYKFSQIAERYAGVAGGTISDVMVWYAVKAGTTGNTSVSIYSVGTDGAPNTNLGTSAIIVKSAIDTGWYTGINHHNIYHFTTPVTAANNFFASVSIPTTFTAATYLTDQLAIGSENMTCSAVNDSAAWLNAAIVGGWMSYYYAFGINIDMMIMPVICTGSGIQDYSAANIIKMYPNPSNDVVNIMSSLNIESIKIMNTIGQTVYENTVDDHFAQISTADLKAGVYFVQVKNKAGITTKSLQVIR